MLSNPTERAVGAEKIKVASPDARALNETAEQLKSVKASVVVYTPMVSNGKMVMVRSEKVGAHVVEQIVARTDMSEDQFTSTMKAAAAPSAEGTRERLAREILPADDRDAAKTVLIRDDASFGVNPSAMQRGDAVVLGSNVDKALQNLKWIQRTRKPDANYVGLFGFPKNQAEYADLFGNTGDFGPLSDWQAHRRTALKTAEEFDIKLLRGSGETAEALKADVLKQLEEADGIVFVVAHADHCRIVIPGRGAIQIEPSDIAALKLRKRPFVVLRICQAADHRFPQAFLEAGASGVWANRGVIDAGVANAQVRSFLKEIRKGKTIQGAIDGVKAADPKAATQSCIFAENRIARTVEEAR